MKNSKKKIKKTIKKIIKPHYPKQKALIEVIFLICRILTFQVKMFFVQNGAVNKFFLPAQDWIEGLDED